MVSKDKTRRVLRALEEKRESEEGLTWEVVCRDLGVSRRTVMNALSWARGEGEHRPSRRTVKAMAKWLRERGVFVGIA